MGQLVEIQIKIKIYKNIERLVLGLKISDKYGQIVWGGNTWHTKQVLNNLFRNDIYLYKYNSVIFYHPLPPKTFL